MYKAMEDNMVRREFIKLICRERFSTDLVRHLINPTTDDDDDDKDMIFVKKKSTW